MTDRITWVAERVSDIPPNPRIPFSPPREYWPQMVEYLGEVVAPDLNSALWRAGKRWGGVGVTVTSRVSWQIAEEERAQFARYEKVPSGWVVGQKRWLGTIKKPKPKDESV